MNVEKNLTKDKKFNLGLMKDLPEQAQDNMTSDWNIPEGMDANRINESEGNQVNFLLAMAKNKLESDDQKIQAEAGRIICHLRQCFDKPEEFSSPEFMKLLQSEVERIWLEGGGEEANELYKNEYLKNTEKYEKSSVKEDKEKFLFDDKFAYDYVEGTNKQIKQLEKQGVEIQSVLKDLIYNNINRIDDFCNQQSKEIDQFTTESEDLGILNENNTKGIRMISRMLSRIPENPNFKNLIDGCKDEKITKKLAFKNIDSKKLDAFNTDEDEKYLDDIVKENEKLVDSVNELKEKIIKQTKKVFEEIATVGNALHDAYKNADEREKKHLEPFVGKFDNTINAIFQISKMTLDTGQKINYEFMNISSVEETDRPEFNETISSVEKEGYRFNPKFSHNTEQGDILINPQVVAYKYKK